MSGLKQQLEDYIKATEELEVKIVEFKTKPRPLLISYNIIFRYLIYYLLFI